MTNLSVSISAERDAFQLASCSQRVSSWSRKKSAASSRVMAPAETAASSCRKISSLLWLYCSKAGTKSDRVIFFSIPG